MDASVPEPDNVSRELIEAVLQENEETRSFSLKSFTVSPGCKKGDNFISIVLSIDAVLQMGEEERKLHLIFKLPHKEGLLKQWLEERVDLFAKESHAYRDIIPAMIRLQGTKGLEKDGLPCPMHYSSRGGGTNGLVVLENLAPKGYAMPNKIKGLSIAHCSLVMKELAKFHALSYGIKDGNPKNIKGLDILQKEGLIVSPIPSHFPAFYKTSLMLAKRFTKDQRLLSAIAKLESLNLLHVLKTLIKPTEPYATICHGDLWFNNLLFRYDVTNGIDTPIDVKFLDLQLLRYSQPTTDLAYFFYTSTTRTMRKENMEKLLTLYHRSFTEYLTKLNIELPQLSFEHFNKLFKLSALFGIIIASLFIFTFLSSEENPTDFTQNEDDVIEHMGHVTEQLLKRDENHEIIQERLIGCIEEAIEMNLL